MIFNSSGGVLDPALTDLSYGGVDPTGGQFMPAPGTITADGTSAISPSGDNNPNPTGGWMQSAAQIVQAASSAFSTYVKGSPAVATPPALRPGTSPTIAASLTKNNTLLIVGGVAVAGVLLLGVLAYAAK